jgi:DNA-binding transcriptional LysR family regulator
MLDIKQIRYFGVLAETLHFGRAAARLNLSQPPLSRQIAALERELGVALFERSSRAVTLTRAGKSFQADAKAILASIEQSAKNALAAGRGERGELAIGFTSCAAFNVMPALARSYAAAFPEVGVKIREMLADELVASVIDGKTDAAIAFPPERQTGLEMRTVYTEPLCVAIGRRHGLAGAARIRVAELASDRFVILSRADSPALYDTIIGHCRSGGFEPHSLFETDLLQTILNSVAEGVGVALVPQSMSRARLRGVAFKPLVKAPIVHQILLWSSRNRNPCLDGFLRLPQPV